MEEHANQFKSSVASAIKEKNPDYDITAESDSQAFEQGISSIVTVNEGTKDGTITASDVCYNKVGYAKGERIVGSVIEVRSMVNTPKRITSLICTTDGKMLRMKSPEDYLIRTNGIIDVGTDVVATAIGLTSDKLPNNYKILVVTGDVPYLQEIKTLYDNYTRNAPNVPIDVVILPRKMPSYGYYSIWPESWVHTVTLSGSYTTVTAKVGDARFNNDGSYFNGTRAIGESNSKNMSGSNWPVPHGNVLVAMTPGGTTTSQFATKLSRRYLGTSLTTQITVEVGLLVKLKDNLTTLPGPVVTSIGGDATIYVNNDGGNVVRSNIICVLY